MHKLLIAIAFVLPLTCVASVNVNLDSNAPLHDVTYSELEQGIGNDVFLLMRSLRRGDIDSSVYTRLNSSIKSSKLFKNLTAHIQKTEKLNKSTDTIASLRRQCTTIPEGKSNHLAEYFVDSIKLYCDSKFLDLLHTKKEATRLNRKNLSYFIYAIPRFVTKSNSYSFSKYLNKVKINASLHRYISLHIGKYFIKHKMRPIPCIMDALHHSTDLQNYLNSIGYYTRKEKRKVVRKMYSLSNKFEKLVESGQMPKADKKFEELISFYKTNSYSIPQETAWKIFITSGKEYRYANAIHKGNELFRMALEMANDEQIDESLFQLIWSDITNMKYNQALEKIEEHNMIERFAKLNSKLKFWISYVIKKNGEIHLAKHLYSELVHTSPLNYYSILALKELSGLEDKETKKSYFRKISSIEFSLKTKQGHHTKEFLNGLRRLAIWTELGLQHFASLEVKSLIYLPKEKVFAKNIFRSQLTKEESQKAVIESIASLLSKHGHHLQTFKLVQNAMGSKIYELDRKTLGYLFPLEYIEEVKKFSENIDPLFVLSLIRQESAFNPEAKSSVGARGLMQLMPTTAKQFKRKVNKEQLNDPNINIKIGVKYLTQLLQKYNGNMIYALSAYNAGESRVKNWRNNIFTTDNPLIVIESIPFRETRLYVKLIYRNLFFYNFLKDSLDFQKPIAKSFTISLND